MARMAPKKYGDKITHTGDELSIQSAMLNPSQQIRLFLRCAGSAHVDQISELDLSHSEGSGIDEREITTISFNFGRILGIELDPRDMKTRITYIGPFRFVENKGG